MLANTIPHLCPMVGVVGMMEGVPTLIPGAQMWYDDSPPHYGQIILIILGAHEWWWCWRGYRRWSLPFDKIARGGEQHSPPNSTLPHLCQG